MAAGFYESASAKKYPRLQILTIESLKVDGPQGIQGPQGDAGPQGAPGEVTNAALATALAGTSANSNGVALLGITVSDPPTQAEMQAVANKLDELITALRR